MLGRARGKEKDETVWDKLTLCSHKLLGACEQEKIWLYLCCQEALSQVWLAWVSLHCACRCNNEGSQELSLFLLGTVQSPRRAMPLQTSLQSPQVRWMQSKGNVNITHKQTGAVFWLKMLHCWQLLEQEESDSQSKVDSLKLHVSSAFHEQHNQGRAQLSADIPSSPFYFNPCSNLN